jgi:hypothetical protein
MSFDLTNPFHIAQVVTDLEASMNELTEGLGVTWHSIQERVMHLRTGNEVIPATVRFVYSKGDEPHIELLQGSQGSIWGPEMAGMHHVGVWTDDFLADAAGLEAAGFPIEVTLASRTTEEPQSFTYHKAHGLRIELVPVEARPAFTTWFAGGEFA